MTEHSETYLLLVFVAALNQKPFVREEAPLCNVTVVDSGLSVSIVHYSKMCSL